ncbi:hypothetical protein GGI21_003056, partial [Coemansia aciculifera]
SSMFSARHHRRRYRHSREQSQASVATFSTHSMPSNEQQLGLEFDNESGSGSGANRRRQRRRPFSTDMNDSSSGQSTPNHLLFARLRRKASGSVKSANTGAAGTVPMTATTSGLCHSPELMPRTPEGRSYKDNVPQHMSASRQLGRSRRGIRTTATRQNDEDDGYSGDVEADGGNEVLYLRFSTSVPDILVMPMVSNVGDRWRTIKRPDYSYEQLLVMSRNTKVRRWKLPQSGLSAIDQQLAADLPGSVAAPHDRTSSPPLQYVIGRRATVGAGTGRNKQQAVTSPAYTAAAGNPIDSVRWTDWTDDVKDASLSPLAQHAVASWHRISQSVDRKRYSRQNSLMARRDSSGSYMSTSNLPRPSMLFSACTMQSSAGALDSAALPLLSGPVTAMLNPYVMEPTLLQRGVSESGRQVSPNSAFSSVYQMPSFASLDSVHSPSMVSADTDSARWSVRTQRGGVGGGGDESVLGLRLPETKSRAGASAFSDAIRGHAATAAPHRRLSIIKDQELGKAWGNLPSVITSPPRLEKTSEVASLGIGSNSSSRRVSPAVVDKSPWIIARLDDPEETIEMLQSFQSRLQLRLSRAKAESEQELVDIIQDLSEFVEEGLSYVNEDGAVYSPYINDSAASEDDYGSDASYASDQNETYSQGLDHVSSLPLAAHATHRHHDRGAGNQFARDIMARPDESTVSVAARELKGLNKRLHDVLSLRSDSREGHVQAVRPASQPSGLQLQLAPSPPQVPSSEAAAAPAGSSARHSPVQRLIRSPSIRRLAFLRALSGDRVNIPTPAADDNDSTIIAEPASSARSRNRLSVELPSALPLFGGSRQKLSEASLQQHLGFASDSALHHQARSDKVPDIVFEHGFELGDDVSRDDDESHVRSSFSVPRITHDPLASWSDLQLDARGKSASPHSEIPFPNLYSKSSMYQRGAEASETSSLSGGGHSSSRMRSQSRSSMYSASSRASLLA